MLEAYFSGPTFSKFSKNLFRNTSTYISYLYRCFLSICPHKNLKIFKSRHNLYSNPEKIIYKPFALINHKKLFGKHRSICTFKLHYFIWYSQNEMSLATLSYLHYFFMVKVLIVLDKHQGSILCSGVSERSIIHL